MGIAGEAVFSDVSEASQTGSHYAVVQHGPKSPNAASKAAIARKHTALGRRSLRSLTELLRLDAPREEARRDRGRKRQNSYEQVEHGEREQREYRHGEDGRQE